MGILVRKLRKGLWSIIEPAANHVSDEAARATWRGSGRAGMLAAMALFEAREGRRYERLRDASAQVFSQFGEDGILDYIFRLVPPKEEFFVEVGVQDFAESNARFLMEARYWSGIVVDAANDAQTWLERNFFHVLRDVHAEQLWVLRDNLGPVLAHAPAEADLFSLDIDGNDYWVWEALPETFRPRVVVVEFQANFGPTAKVSSPYRDDFDRMRHHPTGMAGGASLAALVELGKRRGYDFIGTNGIQNAFFVREDLRPETLPVRTAADEWRVPRFRDAFREDGSRWYPRTMAERTAAIADARVIDLETGQERAFGDL